MVKKLTRTGNSVALVLDKALLEQTGLDEDSEVEVSSDGRVIVVTPVRDKKRDARLRDAVGRAHREYGWVFKKLAE